MVVRGERVEEGAGRLCIPQTQHAAIAGQLARAWGNEAFPAPAPRGAVCLAAERHDDGMEGFDRAPELDPETGLPRSFMRMPLGTWIGCWDRGPAAVGEDNPYAGILVSLHGEHLLGYRQLGGEGSAERAAAEAWRRRQRGLRERLRSAAAEDPLLAEHIDAESLERARKLIEIWDAMSLAICMPRLPETFAAVPCEARTREIEMREVGRRPVAVEVEPWPFSASEVFVAATGRRLRGTYSTDAELREALDAAPLETLEAMLLPAEGRSEPPGHGVPMPPV